VLKDSWTAERARMEERLGAVPGMPPPARGKDLSERVDEARRRLQDRAAAGRAELDEQWRGVQETVEGLGPGSIRR
jgi:hypothetical protein